MREILFRGKRTDNGEWVYGYYTKAMYFLNEKEMHIIFEPDVEAFPHCEFTGYEEVIPETVCQFTCLTDKNGRKVFEGDIVERGGRRWLVEYSNKYGQFMMTTYTEKGISWSRSFDLIPPDWCEVIGNIYDNPELLEVKQNG